MPLYLASKSVVISFRRLTTYKHSSSCCIEADARISLPGNHRSQARGIPGSAQSIYSNKTRNSECRFKARIEKLGKSKFIECMNKNFENRFVVFTFIFLTPCFYLIVSIFTSFTLHTSYYIINFLFGHSQLCESST